MPKNKIHELVMLGILTGLAMLLSYVFAIQTPFVRITFGFSAHRTRRCFLRTVESGAGGRAG